MICPNCLNDNCRCLEGRTVGDKRARRYACMDCGTRIQTVEEIVGIRSADGGPRDYVPIKEEQLQRIRDDWRRRLNDE